ncbi:MAG: hypothetical protein AAFO29_08800, partial [Actinomycetota bacterium]
MSRLLKAPTTRLWWLTPLALVALLGATTDRASAQGGAGVSIEKATNGVDADTAPGPAFEPGQSVSWTWTVQATGDEALYDLVVSDSSGVTPSCDVNGDGQVDGTTIHPGPLEPGQSFVCTATGQADQGTVDAPFLGTGTVRASNFAADTTFQDDDRSYHHVSVPFSPAPGVSIQTVVGGQVATGAEGPLVAEGTSDAWTYVVRNTGNVPLTDIEVTGESGLAIDCGSGGSVIAGPLAPGASISCTSAVPPAEADDGPQSRSGRVGASAIDPTTGASIGQVSDSDAVTVTPVEVPTQLAFTGPGSFLLPIGLALCGLGGVL